MRFAISWLITMQLCSLSWLRITTPARRSARDAALNAQSWFANTSVSTLSGRGCSMDGCMATPCAVRIHRALLAGAPVLHGLRVMSRRRARAIALALLHCDRLSYGGTLDPTKNLHNTALDTSSAGAGVLVGQHQAYCRAAHANTGCSFALVGAARFSGKQTDEQGRFCSPGRDVYTAHWTVPVPVIGASSRRVRCSRSANSGCCFQSMLDHSASRARARSFSSLAHTSS
ncbi:hypothetical protein SAMN05216588_12633 [Pseudomonas flavescens]|uniref:Uncharacterized protein n=1 Tax=Phytopseudomonas flavescens TaxID=29435 RepID=A0A1G8NVM1_9GAMM|nr:hypothetical protein SAMN05216588_12633 [Pseudomonas flavescens]